VGYTYHSFDDLRALGERIRAKAIHVTMTNDTDYGDAQQRANNYGPQVGSGARQPMPGYQQPSSGRPDDDGNLRRFVTAEYAEIPDRFTAFSVPDPNGGQATVDALYQSVATLAPSLEVQLRNGQLYYPVPAGGAPATPVANTVNHMKDHLAHWDGDAAQEVKNYLATFDVAAGLQCQLATSLAVTLQAQLEIRSRMLANIWDIGNKTLKALEALDGWCPSKAQLMTEITVFGAIAAVIDAIPTGGLALVGETALDGAAILALLPGQPQEKPSIGGPTVPAVLSSMQAAMALVAGQVDTAQQEVVSCLKKLEGALTQNMTNIQPDPPRDVPGLMTAGVDVLDGRRRFYDPLVG
jgi:hypothetical protein